MALSWLQRLQRAFGTPFLLLVFTVYWTQGFRSFPWMGINILIKDRLKLGPAAAQLMTSTAYIPWSIKPIYGIVSDCIPIRGQRRVPYIIIANVLTLIPWFILATVEVALSSPSLLTALLVCQNVGAAMADVVVDAMVAESTNKDKEAFAGDLQALSWFSMAVGGILGSVLGGPALKVLSPQRMFGLFALCPLGQFLVCLVTNEKSLIPESMDEEVGQTEARKPLEEKGVGLLKESRGKVANGSSGDAGVGSTGEGDRPELMTDSAASGPAEPHVLADPEKLQQLAGAESESGLRRRSAAATLPHDSGDSDARAGGSGAGLLADADSKDKLKRSRGRELWLLWRKMVLVVRKLWEAVLNPDIHRPMLWFMASCALVPSLQSTMFYYQTNALQLDVSFLGVARVVGWGGLMVGTYAYNSYLKYVPMRKIFRWVHIVMALLTLSDVILTSRLNVKLGIPDKVFVLGASAMGDAIAQFRFMPFLILSARLCPPGIEGTLFALFMSAYNFGNTLSGYVGATLASRLGITSDSFSNLTVAIFIQSACNLLPIMLLFFVPANISGAGEDKRVVREVEVATIPTAVVGKKKEADKRVALEG